DFHDHLAGRDGLDHFHADGALLDLIGKPARHIERHVGLEQSASHLAERGFDISFRQRAASGQLVKDAIEAFRKTVEHRVPYSVMPGHSRSKNGIASLAYAGHPCGQTATWIAGSSPAMTIGARGRIALSGGLPPASWAGRRLILFS